MVTIIDIKQTDSSQVLNKYMVSSIIIRRLYGICGLNVFLFIFVIFLHDPLRPTGWEPLQYYRFKPVLDCVIRNSVFVIVSFVLFTILNKDFIISNRRIYLLKSLLLSHIVNTITNPTDHSREGCIKFYNNQTFVPNLLITTKIGITVVFVANVKLAYLKYVYLRL